MKVLFYDLETTGFRPCDIMQICMIGIDTDDEYQILEFTSLVNPGDKQINPRVPHNLTLEDVRESPQFDEISEELIEFITGAMLVGFNNHAFDDRVLQDAFGIEELNKFIHSSHDILSLMGRGITQNRALDKNGLMNPIPHDAKYDVMSLIALVNRLELGEDIPEECSTAARSLVELLDMTEFNQRTEEEIPNYEESFVGGDGIITVGIYAGHSLESVRVTDPWFAKWLDQRMA